MRRSTRPSWRRRLRLGKTRRRLALGNEPGRGGRCGADDAGHRSFRRLAEIAGRCAVELERNQEQRLEITQRPIAAGWIDADCAVIPPIAVIRSVYRFILRRCGDEENGRAPRRMRWQIIFQIRSKYRLRSQSVTAELNAACSVRKKCA